MSKVVPLNKIENIDVRRLPTTIVEIDRVYGQTRLFNGDIEYGLPCGKISYWAGGNGVGKTRIAIHIAKKMNQIGARILYFQGEVPADEFKQWTGEVPNPQNFMVSEDTSAEDIAEGILKSKPDLCVIDSANMIQDYDKKSKIKKIFEVLRKVVASVGCHLIMIAQLNQDGTVKGGTVAPHLVDIVVELDVVPQKVAKVTGAFFLQIKKNRYGKSGGWVGFRHFDYGIEAVRYHLS